MNYIASRDNGLAYILSYLCSTSKKLDSRYNKFNDNVVLHRFMKDKYDNKHTIVSIYAILGIKITTIECDDSKFIIVYKDDKCISTLVLKKDKPINDEIKCILGIEFLDDILIKNTIMVFNCGIIIHGNCLTRHIYNYKGEQRLLLSH